MTLQEISVAYNLPDMPVQNNIAYRKVLAQLPNNITDQIDVNKETADKLLEKLKTVALTNMYKFCKEPIQKSPDRVTRKWEEDLAQPLDEWHSLLSSNYLLTNETKLQTFIFKLFHRIIPTEEFLYKVGISNTDICRLCEEQIETLIHYMCTCPVVEQFWQDVRHWIETRMGNIIPLDLRILVFGNMEKSGENYVLLLARYYLYLCKHKVRFPQLREFLAVLKQHCRLENWMNHKANHVEALFAILA